MDERELRSNCDFLKVFLLGETSVPFTILMIFIVLLVMTFVGCSKPSSDSANSPVASYGEGSCKLIIFTDYFCTSCQALESDLEPILNKLMEKGGVEITLVDAPVNKLTQLYGKYFLYAANANRGFKDILHARNALFSIAKNSAVSTEEDLALKLKAQGVAFQPYDLSKVYIAMNEMMKNHDIRSTPVCVVKYSNSDTRKYTGPEEIKRGLSLLLSSQKLAN